MNMQMQLFVQVCSFGKSGGTQPPNLGNFLYWQLNPKRPAKR